VGPYALTVRRPRSAEDLLDEKAFEREEFLPYWAELWPSGLALARALCRRDVAATRVLELGCGLGLPSLAAALRGADVLATDWSPEAVTLLRRNAVRAGVDVEGRAVDWSSADELSDAGPWDLVLASDVLYERRNVSSLLALLPRLVRDGEVLVAEPGRPPARAFLSEARERWHVRTAPLQRSPRVDLHALRLRAP
ncbi:MAG: methyltransferase domain-containing protein, partial [Actinomycetota bacterium]|nr:methyltransferase domain-containing protein [Actinomycetota bacterium]